MDDDDLEATIDNIMGRMAIRKALRASDLICAMTTNGGCTKGFANRLS